MNLTRYHRVFAPRSAEHAQVTLARRGRHLLPTPDKEPKSGAERRGVMTWARR